MSELDKATPLIPQSGEEIFDVVDEHDRVLRQATRDDVHKNDWWHRAVHIWLFDSDGRLLLQMRSPHKDQYPSTWTSSASGHVDAGEDYETAARRELSEELGLSVPLEPLVKLPPSAATAYEFTSLWIGTTDQPPKPNSVEVTAVEWWDIPAAHEAMISEPEIFSPPLRELITWWLTHQRDSRA